MEHVEIMEFEEYCKKFIYDGLDSLEGTAKYACDLGYYICEGICVNRTATMSRSLAIEYIKEWWHDAADYFEYEETNYGKHIHNPFDCPESFMVCMILWGCEQMLSQVDVVSDNWNEKIEIHEILINHIKDELEFIHI